MKLAKNVILSMGIISMVQLANASDYEIKGDIRYRYENREADEVTEKSRERIRARIGVYGDINESISFGTRIATGGTGITSTNQDLNDAAANKGIGLDLAYMTIDSLLFEGVDTTLGKMKQPWTCVSDLIYDSDVTPEGIAFNYATGNISYHAGHFIIGENKGDDAQLASFQFVADVSDNLSVGSSFYTFSNMENAYENKSYNTTNEFELIEFFATYKIETTPLPLKIFANYVENGAADDANTAYMVGVGTKSGKWGFDYNYREIELNSVYDEWADSDFHDGGTGGQGHKFKAKYALKDGLSLGATYFLTEREDETEVNTLQIDLATKF
tara:strand:+ start:2252 stop:3238 length:987 start_codon:yes stop_codon:yes gene_type:complete